jgi:hypothetical protein
MKRIWLRITIVLGFIAGLCVASLFGYAAWDHNPQGEFHDWETGAIHWDTFGSLIGLAFGLPFLAILIVSGSLYLVFTLVRKYTT